MTQQMLRDITDAYGDIDYPNWAFVCNRYEAKPYQGLESQLRNFADIKSELEYNYDTMVFYSITHGSEFLGLFVSLVGRYAYVGNINGIVLNEQELCSNELGGRVLDVLHTEGIRMLSVDEMKEEIYFNKEHTTLCRALFSEYAPPWAWHDSPWKRW